LKIDYCGETITPLPQYNNNPQQVEIIFSSVT